MFKSATQPSEPDLAVFTTALAQAVHDRDRERKIAIRYYYDAACVIPLILGLRFFAESGTRQAEDRSARQVHALLASGYLGQVHLLRPHAAEVRDYIERHGSGESAAERMRYQQLVTTYFVEHGVQDNIARLRATLHDTSDPDERHARFTRELRELGPDTFVALELARGDWRQRLVRLHESVIRFIDPSQDATDHQRQLQEMLVSPAFDAFLYELSKERHLATVNNFADAVALTSLHRQIHELDASREEVRFHTPSSTFMRLFASPVGKELLAYPEDEEGVAGILRTTQYYIVRASFAALHFRGAVSRHDGAPAVTLDELRRVVEELRDALREVASASEILDRLQIGGRALGDVLEDLEQFSFVDAVLTRYAPPQAIGALADDLDEVFSTTRTPEVRESLRARIRHEADILLQSLGRETGPLHDVSRLVHDVQTFIESRPPETSRALGPPHRDLGIALWGTTIAPEDEEEIRPLIEAFFLPTAHAEVLRACATLADMARAPGTATRCVAIAAIFWRMGLFRRVIAVMTQFEETVESMPLALQLMRFAARLRRGALGRGEREMQLDAFERLARREPNDEQRAVLLLSIAHVTTIASASATQHDASLIRKSVELATEAALLLAPWSLSWCFAINHCAFLGTTFRIDSGITHECVTSLIQMRATFAWHYRFAETLANVYIQRARDRVTARNLDRHERANVRGMLSYATELLDGAGPAYGDPAIQVRRAEIQSLLRLVTA
jgi:hypothetical protein